MVKALKKILFISDDFRLDDRDCFKEIKNGNYFYGGDESNWLKFEVDIVERFKDFTTCNGYDIVLIDYGVIGDGDEGETVKKLQDIYNKGIKMAWVGGLGYGDYYNRDVKKLFPRQRFLHNLPSSCTGDDDILWLLYSIFEKEVKDGDE